MKTRESGMPDEATWEGYFDPSKVLHSLGLRPGTRLAVEFGSGYGTFCLAAARMIRGRVIGLDIDSELVSLCVRKAEVADLQNAEFEVRDFVARGTGLDDGSVDYAMLFNILHAEKPGILLNETRRILSFDGVLAVMHWNFDPETPRGPSMAIRPRPEDCQEWTRQAGFTEIGPIVDLSPWHYGFTAKH